MPNVVSLLARSAARVPRRPALVTRRRTLTFAELWDRVDRASAGLVGRGLERGHRIACLAPVSPDLYVALLAVLKAGGTAVFLDPWLVRGHLRPDGIVGSWGALLHPALLRVRLRARVGSRRLERERGGGRIAPADDDTPALVTYTGGSGGPPKAITRTHGTLRAQHDALAEAFPVRDDDVDVTTLPVFVLRNLAAGVPSLLPDLDLRRVDRFRPARVRRDLDRFGVTTCTASPAFLDRLAETGAPGLRRILTGGAPVTDAQLEGWRAAFPRADVVVVYGSTEAEPVAHIRAEERLSLTGRGICLGRPVPQVRVALGGEPGEIRVAGRHVCADGWHGMGDVGYRDAKGRLWLVGRVHSEIARGGKTYHAQELEAAARGRDPRVRRVAAVGLDGRVVLVVEGAADPGAVRRRVRAAGLPVDDVLPSRGPLPVDPRHRSKIDYARLRRELEAARC